MSSSNRIGRVSASEKYPATVDEFYFWIRDNTLIRPFDIIKVPHYEETVTYGVIEKSDRTLVVQIKCGLWPKPLI